MVQDNGALHLVDYDGIFLPRFQGEPSPEIGHRHYQHPKRTDQDYHEEIDNFPSLVVYTDPDGRRCTTANYGTGSTTRKTCSSPGRTLPTRPTPTASRR